MVTPAVVPSNPVQGLIMELSRLLCTLSSGEGCMVIM